MKNSLSNKVLHFFEKYNLLSSENRLLIGFSGGVDSLCLLDILIKLSKQYHFKVIAAHLNHNWRKDESKNEEIKARKFCQERNIEFYTEILPGNLPHTEIEARNQRYGFFNKAATKLNATAILTGHTLTDNVETILYRIIKGTGTVGLQGIPEKRLQKNYPPIYRPLLDISREETIKYCKENNLEPSYDSSNLDIKYLRNKIRLKLIPELKNYNNKIEKAILKLSCLSEDAETLINEYLKQIKTEITTKNGEIITSKFLNLSSAAQRKIIVDFLLNNSLDYDFDRIERILSFIKANSRLKSGNTLSISQNCWIFVSFSIIKLIHFIKADVLKLSIPINPDGETIIPEMGKKIIISQWKGGKPEKFPVETANIAYVDLSNIKISAIVARTRQNGDKIQPFGMKAKTKLKKYLINKGIPEFKRDNLLLLTVDSEILWVINVGLSEILRVKGTPTHVIQILDC